jgi:hypothetical protein
VKIIVHGPVAGAGPGGGIESWVPDQPVDINDGDKKAVAWARQRIAAGIATLVEDAPEPVKRGPGRPPKNPALPG